MKAGSSDGWPDLDLTILCRCNRQAGTLQVSGSEGIVSSVRLGSYAQLGVYHLGHRDEWYD